MHALRGIALKTTAILLFSVMAALIKATSEAVPPGQQVFFRAFFALPVIVIWLAWRGELRTGFRAERPMGHVWRGVIGVTAMICGFAGLGLLPLPEVTALGFAAPLLTVIFAALILGERVRLFRLSAVALGLVGVMIVLWPRLTVYDLTGAATLGVVFVLISATLRALAQIHIRRLVATEQTSAIVFWFSMTATLFSLFTIPFGWQVPSLATAATLVCAGLIGGIGQIFLTSAYRFAGAALLAPFDYAAMLFAVVIGYVAFDEVPTPMVLLGSLVVMMAGGLIIWRERQLGLQRGKARPAMTEKG